MKKLLLSLLSVATFTFSYAQTNFDLESWTAGNPDGWFTLNDSVTPSYVTQVTGNGGGSAMQVEVDTVRWNTGTSRAGELDTLGSALQVFQSALVLDSLTFDYMTNHVGTDSSNVALIFVNNGQFFLVGSVVVRNSGWTSATIDTRAFYANVTGAPGAQAQLILVVNANNTGDDFGSTITVDNFMLHSSGTINVPELENNASVKLYPNPATSNVTIETENVQDAQIRVLDLNGRVINTINATSSRTDINVESFENGMYIYQVISSRGEMIKTGKFVKQ